MSKLEKDSESAGTLQPAYRGYERQACFVAHSHDTDWREDLVQACEEVLPKFGLQPWYADQHFDPTRPLRTKVVEAIANGRYGIYDISNWQDSAGQWQSPRNVYIELGMAVALNRPTLILRHSSNRSCPLPACLNGLNILEFSGATTLTWALEKHLPQWTNVPPDRDWFNRFCIFGERVCGFREEHPRARQLGERVMHCHVSDGFSAEQVPARSPEREEARAVIEEIFGRYADLEFHHLGELGLTEGYQFLLCSHCQAVRSSQFAVYRIMPETPAEVFIAIGMSIAIETVFDYDIPKVILVRREHDLPSLLRGYEFVEVANSTELKRKLRAFVPTVMQKVRETSWKPRPLPFIEHLPTPADEQIRAPVKARTEPLFQLPPRNPMFVGRQPLIQIALQSMSEESDAKISFIGPGGIGKTTLATEIAWRAADLNIFPDGILWADFYVALALSEVLKDWIEALGGDAAEAPLYELTERWRNLIDKKHLLIVLDGAEFAETRDLAALIFPANCSMLLTSRDNSFAYEGNVVLGLHPLSQEESASLLLALLSGSKAAPAPLTTAELDEVTTAAEGIPLALKVIAGRLAREPVRVVLDQLKKSGATLPTPSAPATLGQTDWAISPDSFVLRVASEVETIMQREMFTPPGGPTYLPPEYQVFFSNQDDSAWTGAERRGLAQVLARLLSESARRLSGTNQLAVESFGVEIRVDGTLGKGEFYVQPIWDVGQVQVTAGVPTTFSVGEKVVYPNYGIGTIEAIEEKQVAADSLLFYTLRLAANNSVVRVPVANVKEIGLRRPITVSQCHSLLRTLAGDFVNSSPKLNNRFRVWTEKLRTGDIFEAADVLKQLTYALRSRSLHFREQRIFDRVRPFVILEIAEVTGQSESSVERDVDEALAIAIAKHKTHD